jgi:uncharacterized protein YneF (UPF0154 family)
MSEIYIYLGFALAAYSVIGNDVIQTLGTFISSNEKKPWWVLWLFAGGILTATLLYGWYVNGGDVSYGRLIGDASKMCGDPEAPCSIDNPKYPFVSNMSWWYLLPPIVLLIVTRMGIPVSTSFLILTFFLPKGLTGMIVKSLIGYAVAFGAGLIFYVITAQYIEKRFKDNPEMTQRTQLIWTILQWGSTGFLWTQWLIQDFANIYVYLPRTISPTVMLVSLLWLLALLAYIFWSKGGAIQGIVKSKSGTTDIRSATFVDLIYGIVLYIFKEVNKVPMSTTWVFIGLLAGREYGYRLMLNREGVNKKLHLMVIRDIGKATLGLVISVVLVYFIHVLKTGTFVMSFS